MSNSAQTSSPKSRFALRGAKLAPVLVALALAGCMGNDAERMAAGAVIGGTIAGVTGGDVVGGAALGAGAGYLSR